CARSAPNYYDTGYYDDYFDNW
nr:immunoglobulin heavy chain junction region [Macaca mulatta]MOV53413.1 immunoglobulin heavy chain junction region [Macaca mulatta]MOV53618.1 immunoglobulin heavy chain junction region [Macaca mulatta]MOV53656.1 immunoglobulin heavy chain junction region [Macaca mulatta]MOV53706.1 immunoglobulin heavy chain junction region [Macaca mulatta]